MAGKNPDKPNRPLVVALAIFVAVVVVILALPLLTSERRMDERLAHRYDVADPQFQRVLSALLGPPLVPGNRVDTLVNGREIFPAMLAAIRSARQTITFETYIYWSGEIGKQFADALAERARAGVKVHVLVDWVGSQKLDEAYVEQMKQAGVEIGKYHHPHLHSWSKLNNRTHRKLLVVDGRIGFTGGVGIADEWNGDAQDPGHWRDTHYRVEGPAVAQMQSAFVDNWVTVDGKVLYTAEYFPELAPAGPRTAQMFKSSSEGGSESMHLMYLLSVASARRSIDLSMAYFVPDELAIDALVAAAGRGVKVRIIVPGRHIDAELVRKASRRTWGDLLRAGIEIHEYQPTMFHCKVLVVDGVWTSVGSTNFDNRSFRLNDEANLNVLDGDFAARQIEIFEQDLLRTKKVSLQDWEDRPFREKLLETVFPLFDMQL